MRVNRNVTTYQSQIALAIMAGWVASPPNHRSLEAMAAELEDLTERDLAARAAFQQRAAQ
jgi:hypothetical protein